MLIEEKKNIESINKKRKKTPKPSEQHIAVVADRIYTYITIPNVQQQQQQ